VDSFKIFLKVYDKVLIWNDLVKYLFLFFASSFSFFLSAFPQKAAQVAIETAIATVDHPDIRGSKPHNRDPSGATSD
jgi:hypothetical protein